MRIFLIRHAESISNAGQNYKERIPDNLVCLTEKGIAQANEAGAWLKEYCDADRVDFEKARAWRSPYIRTRQTCDEFNKHLQVSTVRDTILLTEQRFGLLDSRKDEESQILFTNEWEECQRHLNNSSKFYAKRPMGDSPYDVAVRIPSFFGTIHRDFDKHGIEILFIFTHGTTLRCFLLSWFHYTPEWYEEEPNPKNCWIREINGDVDKGYIYCK